MHAIYSQMVQKINQNIYRQRMQMWQKKVVELE